MRNYYKYLPTGQEDESWGLHVLNAGCNHIPPHGEYPATSHPHHHYFNWHQGRVLQEYQVIYITNGEGCFESAQIGHRNITEGTMLLLFPGEWHRFKPATGTGWDEYWVGFNGSIINKLMQNEFFHPSEAVLHTGMQDHLLQLFSVIIEATKVEKTGYQALISGAVLHLLGAIHTEMKQKNLEAADIVEPVINKARIILRSNIDQQISVEQIAEELNVSYSWFRKAFKAYTGMAPGQYHLQLKIERAKELLADASKSVKQIAYELNFESAFYFSSLFKKKIGLSPEQYRKKLTQGGIEPK